ncbi:MAG: multifunctional CCA protein [Candidatus Parcubacteria bacterium]|nr:MAG: multifunctional CCA protein [Candidatus Parcubacteria bacterium]
MDTIKNKIKNSLSYYFDLLSEIESKFKVKAYIVGGAVRDAGIDEKVKDIDIVIIPYRYNVSINLLELQTKKISPAQAFPVYIYTSDNPKYSNQQYELAIGRKEYKTGIGHKGFNIVPADDIYTDLLRRDFTINAIAIDKNGELHYPKDALRDLEKRLLNPVVEKHFVEDPLRYYRALRFATKGFSLTLRMINTLNNIPQYELESIPNERISNEMMKAFGGKYPERFFTCMALLNNIPNKFQHIKKCLYVPSGRGEKHSDERHLLDHLNKVLKLSTRLTNDYNVRLAAFYHDIGKIFTDPKEYPRHYGHEQNGYDFAIKWFKDMRFENKTVEIVSRACRYHMLIDNYYNLRLSKLIDIVSENKYYIKELVMVSICDVDDERYEREVWDVFNLVLEVVNMKPSILIGEEKLKELSRKNPENIRSLLKQRRVEILKEKLLSDIKFSNYMIMQKVI